MDKLLVQGGWMFKVNTDNNTVKKADTAHAAVDHVYLVDKDQIAYFQNGDTVTPVDIKAGQIIVTFYDDVYPHRYIVVDSTEWAENIKAAKAEEQHQKEEWAARKKATIIKD